jgi:N-acetylneuraminate synthase
VISEIHISARKIGVDHPVYFVADIAANHDGDLQRAKDLIYLAAESGADAAKFQNFQAETIASDIGFKSLGAKFSHQSKWEKSVFDVYSEAALPLDWTPVLKETCDEAGIHYFTAPYDLSLLQDLSHFVCAWKIGSGDITWIELIERIATFDKPVLLATGAADWEDVTRAVEAIMSKTRQLVLMQCNTNYTGDRNNFQYLNLRVLEKFREFYPNIVMGLSDHTPGHTSVLGAVTLGARVIEKHFTDDITRDGPDHGFSMTPESWKSMVIATEDLVAALGNSEKRIMPNEADTAILQRRAVRAGRDIAAGELITREMLTFLRPCPTDGFAPFEENKVVGKIAQKPVLKGEHLRVGDLT